MRTSSADSKTEDMMKGKRVYVRAIVGSIVVAALVILAMAEISHGVSSGNFGQLCVLGLLGVIQLEHFNEEKEGGWARYFLVASSWMTMALVIGAFVAMLRDPRFFEPMWFGAISFCCVALALEAARWGWPFGLLEGEDSTGARERV